MKINSFDMDGVLTVGLYPGPNDIIITGRSIEESAETRTWLRNRGIKNLVLYNPAAFDKKTRESSGQHKAFEIMRLKEENGIEIVNHFEDDEIQAKVIERECPWINVVRVIHDLTEKENIRHFED